MSSLAFTFGSFVADVPPPITQSTEAETVPPTQKSVAETSGAPSTDIVAVTEAPVTPKATNGSTNTVPIVGAIIAVAIAVPVVLTVFRKRKTTNR
jgi:hypothetical protein